MVVTVLVTSLAGSMGAVCRYGATRLGNVLFVDVRLPVATLVINIIGSLFLGIVVTNLKSTSLIGQLSGGFLAGFTTFSTFTNEVVTLYKEFPLLAVCYFIISIVLSVCAAAIGLII